MKLNHLIYTLMLGTALGTSSCSWLDLEPATAVSPANRYLPLVTERPGSRHLGTL